MTAYNRVTKRFQDGHNIDMNDLNAMLADIQAAIIKRYGTGTGGGVSVGTPAPVADSLFITADNSNITADAA